MASLSSARVVVTAVIGNGIITIAKFFGWMLTGSPSMLAESIHSAADTANQVLLYIGVRQSLGAPTRMYPWGKGNARYLWNLVSAVAVFFVGFGVTTYHGIHSLVNLHHIKMGSMGWIPIVILIMSFLIEGYVLTLALTKVNELRGEQSLWSYIKTGDDPTAVAVLLEDSVAVLGVVLAMVGIGISQVYNTALPDAITSIIIGILLGMLAIILAMANGRLLIGVATPKAEEDEIRKFIESQSNVEKVNKLKTIVLGPDRIMLAIEVEFHGSTIIDREQISRDAEKIRSGQEDPVPILVDTAERTVRIVGSTINKLEAKIAKEFPQIVMIELEVN